MFSKKCIDNRKKYPKRKVLENVSEEVKERDVVCIICWGEIQAIHHVYYWGDKQYDEWRNWADRCCGLCNNCHHKLHFESNNYRQLTIEYIWQFQKNQ